MGILNITNYSTVTPRRVVDSANNTRVDTAPIDYVLVLNEPTPLLTDRGALWVQTGDLFVRRGSDLQDGDEITVPQGRFGIIGGAQYDTDHPLTGADFGWVKYTVRRGG